MRMGGWIRFGTMLMLGTAVAGGNPCQAATSSTVFDYRGTLSRDGAAADGHFDLRFSLHDEPTGGNAIGTVLVEDVAVHDGTFEVALDFGMAAFTCGGRFLEIGVRPAGAGDFERLFPRQLLKSARSDCAVDGDLTVAGDLHVGTVGGTWNELQLMPQNDDAEGGEIHLMGAAAYTDWREDVLGDDLRLFNFADVPSTVQIFNALWDINETALFVQGPISSGTMTRSARFNIGGVGSDLSYGHGALFIENANTYLDWAGGAVLRGSGSDWGTRITNTDNLSPTGEVVGIYRAEVTPGDVSLWGGVPIATFANDGVVAIGRNGDEGLLDVYGSIYQRGTLLYADHVLEPGFQLEPIEEHAAAMRGAGHLPGLAAKCIDTDGYEVVELGGQQRGLVEELEKAHLYIEQLHQRLAELEARLAAVERGVAVAD